MVSFFIIVPFIKTSNGESLIRFDVNKLNLFFFGQTISFDNFFNISVFILILVFFIILVTQIFGKIWCGWICPQSLCNDIIVKISSKVRNKTVRKIVDIFWSFVAAFVLTTVCVFYFVSPYEFFSVLAGTGGKAMATIWCVLFVALFLDFAFIRYKWCKTICPYARAQFLMSDDNTLYVGMLHGEDSKCIECLACVKSCPVQIDPRKTPNGSCIYCENCIKACDKVLKRRGGKSIIGYNWGSAAKFSPKRANLIITFCVTVLFVVLFVYNLLGNRALMVEIKEARIVDNGSIILEAYLENNLPSNVLINFSSPDSGASLDPSYVVMGMKTDKELTLNINSSEKDIKSLVLHISNNKGNTVVKDIKLK